MNKQQVSQYEGRSVLIFDQTCAVEKREEEKEVWMEDSKKSSHK